jgi:uncharacterized membrane protein
VTRYDFLLFLHVSFAVIWLGGATIIQFFALRALMTRSGERLAAFAGDTEWIASRVLTVVALGAFLSGVALVWDAPFWGFGDDWIVIGLVLFGVTFLAGVLFFGPEAGRVGKLVTAEGPESSRVQARIKRLIVLSRIDLVVLFLIIFDMTVKPSFSDGGTIIAALVVAAAVAGLLVLPAFRPARKPTAA